VLALLAAAVAAPATAVIWRIASSRDQADTATVFAGYLAAAGIAITLLVAVGGWWQKGRPAPAGQASAPSQVAAAADRLAEVMADTWRREAAGRRIVTPAPATVRWRWAADAITVPRQEVATPPAAGTGPPSLPGLEEPGELLGSGVVTRLHDELYARLPHGRLVLVGGPGAGKTGAMILLLLAALDHRANLTGGQRVRVPVPVWLTLGRWNPATTSLGQWAADTMNRDHPVLRTPEFGGDAAGDLLRGGRVALFLDGLDEMPDGVRARALRRISDEAQGLRVVITSRPMEYRHALPAGRPDNTAVIELRPVGPGAAAAYLLHGQSGLARQRWERFGGYLRDNPGSVSARTLDNPLVLSLARDACASADPAMLADPGRFPTVAALREHLIDQVLITAHPDERQRARATDRLAWIAGHMGDSRDLAWWDIPAWTSPGKLRVVRGVTAGLLFGLADAILLGPPAGLEYGAGPGIAFGIGGALVTGLGGLIAGLAAKLTGAPQTLVRRWPSPRELVRSLTTRSSYWPVGAWAVGAADSPSATAPGTYRSDCRTSILAGSLAGLICGLDFGIQIGLMDGSTFKVASRYLLALALGTGLGTGLVTGLGTGLLTGQAPLVTWSGLIRTPGLGGRLRFLRLLEDAHGRQVLRQAGAVYQFRHAALQDRLAATHSDSGSPAGDQAAELISR
jgi:hypothetical protein